MLFVFFAKRESSESRRRTYNDSGDSKQLRKGFEYSGTMNHLSFV